MLGIRTLPGDAVTHRLSPVFLTEFWSGAISEQSMSALSTSVHSQRRAMLLAVITRLPGHPGLSQFRAELEQARKILVEVDEREPAIVKGVLLHPSTGVWLVRALRALLGNGDLDEVHYLRSVAAATAIRAGHPCTVIVPVVHGIVSLPTVGHVRIAGQDRFVELRNSPTSATLLSTDTDESIVFSHGMESTAFTPTRYHRAKAHRIDLLVEIDDSHPYRAFSQPEPPDLLDPAEWAQWHELFDNAWNILTQRHRPYAVELAAGLRAVAPVRGIQNFAGSSSNAAFGAVALSSKSSGEALAEVLIHELQHSKLNALLELVELRHEGTDRWWYAPWRADPRPLIGLLHGIYAFVSVVEFWRDQRDHVSDPRLALEGNFAFAHRRSQVRQAVDALTGTPELTELGSQLVAAVSQRLKACEADTVPADLTDTVALIQLDHWISWRLHHVRSDDAYIELLAEAWRDEGAAPAQTAAIRVEPFHRPPSAPTRITLLKAKAIDPARHAELTKTATAEDIAFVSGDYDVASTGYSSRIRLAHDNTHAWAGLALTAPRTAAAFRAAPEVVVDLHNRLGGTPDPMDLATWLSASRQP